MFSTAMYYLQQRVYTDHFHSINLNYQSNSKNIKTKETGFTSDHSEDNEIEFQLQTNVADQYADSPTLWTKKASTDATFEAPPLLPSPSRRLQPIADSRRAFMAMIQNMPESSYELSLKDIVDAKQSVEEVQQEERVEESTESTGKCRAEVEIVQKKKNTRQGAISRCESMESGVFLLKMFIPVSLGSKKKPKTRTCSKVSPGPSLDGAESCKCISRSISSISSSTHGLFGSYFLTGWGSSNGAKCKSRRKRGCLF